MRHENASGWGRGSRGHSVHAGKVGVEIHHDVFRGEHLNAPNRGLLTGALEDSSPEINVLLHDSSAAGKDDTGRINQFGVGPVVFAIGAAVRTIPGLDEAVDHGLGGAIGLVLW